MSNRVPGKLGRLPAVFPAALRTLDYYVAGPLPKAPVSVAVPKVADWGMDSNDTLGCCGVAGIDHLFKAAAADTGAKESFPAGKQVGEYYLHYTHGQDSGVVLSQFLAYVRKQKFFGHSVSAYAPVTVNDVPTLQFTINAYDSAYVGIAVYEGMMSAVQGNPEGPWTWTAGDVSGQVVGGHCIILCGYDSQWIYGITWGQVIRIAYPAWHKMADEAWAVIPGEIASKGTDGHGINLAALQADLSKVDTAAPASLPLPGPLAELAKMLRRAEVDAETILDDARNFLSRHGL